MSEIALFSNDEFVFDGPTSPNTAPPLPDPPADVDVREVDHPRFGLVYVLSDLARALGKRDAKQLCRTVRVTRKIIVQTVGGPQPMLVATADEVRSIIGRSRGHRVREVAARIGYGDLFMPPIETDTLATVARALRDFHPRAQLACDRYRIDLYVHDLAVAIECDEDDHATRDQTYERAREAFIQARLSCTFVRFNPDAADFNVGDVIAEALSVGRICTSGGAA